MMSSRHLTIVLLLGLVSAAFGDGSPDEEASQAVHVEKDGQVNDIGEDVIQDGPVESLQDLTGVEESDGAGPPSENEVSSQGEKGSDLPVQNENDEMPVGEGKTNNPDLGSTPDKSPDTENYRLPFDEDDRTGKILAYYTTKVKNLFATTTVSRLSTCFSATNTPQCMGRRKKRHLDRNLDAAVFDLEGSEDLQGTVADPLEPQFENGKESRGDRDPKKFTVWSTMFSTFTLTSTYYYPGTTVTVSGVCVLPGLGSGCFG